MWITFEIRIEPDPSIRIIILLEGLYAGLDFEFCGKFSAIRFTDVAGSMKYKFLS